jgi:hypothetical protein
MTGAVSLATGPCWTTYCRTPSRCTYKRCAIRYSNHIPTFNDLREELANWRDEERVERTIDEAKLVAIKLRLWTAEKGIYSKLFDSPTTTRLNSNWLFFDIEGLKRSPRSRPRGAWSSPTR